MRMDDDQLNLPGGKSGTEAVFTASILIFGLIFSGLVVYFMNKPQLASEEGNFFKRESERYDNKARFEFYIQPIEPAELPLSPDNRKLIEIDIKTQQMKIFENNNVLGEFPVSTGKNSTPTKRGNFSVISKYPMGYGGSGGDIWAMPFFMGVYKAGGQENGIHELPFINGYRESSRSLGRRLSHGCIRLGIGPAEKIYNWAEIGTEVIIK